MKKHFFLSLLSFFTVVLNAQPTLMRVTNPSNPIVADGGQAGYAGASWVDYDNDGDADLFVNNDRLYRNDGAGQFTKITRIGCDILSTSWIPMRPLNPSSVSCAAFAL